MKKGFSKKILFAIFGLLLLPIIAISFLFSNKIEASNIISVNPDEVIEKSYVGSGDLIDIKGTINGDVLLSGGEINFSGTINGNLIVAGSTINLKGIVNGFVIVAGNTVNIESTHASTLFAAGNMITVNSSVEKNAYLAGNIITLTTNASIGQDLFVGGSSVTINSRVGRDLNVGSSMVNLNSEIGGNAKISADSISINNNTKILKNLDYNENARISGDLLMAVHGTISKYKENTHKTPVINLFVTKLIDKLIFGLFTTLVLGFLFVKFFSKPINKTNKQNEENFFKNFGIGLLFTIICPMLFILLLITIIGVKLAFIVLFVYILTFLVANVFASIFVGNYFLKNILNYKKYSSYLAVFVGALIIILLSLIPYVGWVINFILVSSSIGSLYYLKKEVLETVNKNFK